MKKNAERLRQALSESHSLAKRLDDPGFPLEELAVVQDWQRERLEKSYRDLTCQQRYRAAGDFFLTQLYGGLHFRERDQEMERVLPVMVRMLRDDMLLALAESFDLQILSFGFDMEMAAALQQSHWNTLDNPRYGALYRTVGRSSDRAEQIDLIRHLGIKLNNLVHHRLVLFLIRTLRGPARAAGFGLLQSFLEQGLFAFREMGDGTVFVETVWRREGEVMQRLFAGNDNPFA